MKEDFLNHIKTASIFSGKTNEVKLAINPAKNQIEISSQSQDIGEYQSSSPAKIKGKGMEIAFNHKFLTEGILNAISGQVKNDEIVFELVGEESAAVLKPAEGADYLYVLMPIKKT